MFTTNTVQATGVPTLQYQEHAVQKSQGKNIENTQPKTNQQQTQNTGQQVCFNFTFHIKRLIYFSPNSFYFEMRLLGISSVLLYDEREHDPEVSTRHSNPRRHSQPDAVGHRRRYKDVLYCATVRLQLCARQSDAARSERRHHRRPSAKCNIQYQF